MTKTTQKYVIPHSSNTGAWLTASQASKSQVPDPNHETSLCEDETKCKGDGKGATACQGDKRGSSGQPKLPTFAHKGSLVKAAIKRQGDNLASTRKTNPQVAKDKTPILKKPTQRQVDNPASSTCQPKSPDDGPDICHCPCPSCGSCTQPAKKKEKQAEGKKTEAPARSSCRPEGIWVLDGSLCMMKPGLLSRNKLRNV